MKTVRILNYILFTSMLSFCGCKGRVSEQEKIINEFTQALLNDSIESGVIIERFVKHDDRTNELLFLQISAVREEFKKQGIKMSDLEIVDYDEGEEKMKGLMINEDEEDQVFAVLYKKELFFPIKVTGKKIESFATMNKGGRRFFFKYD